MMKINVEVDLEDFFQNFNGEKMGEVVADEVKHEIMKIVKRDPKYKSFVNKKARDVLDGLDV